MNKNFILSILCGIILFLSVIFLIKFGNIKGGGNSTKRDIIQQISPNISANIVLGGELAEENDKIYYANANDGWSLYVKNLKENTEKKLDEVDCDNIIIGDGWVYYRDVQNRQIIKMKLDGYQKKVVYKGIVDNLIYHEGFLYFIEDNDKGQDIIKMKCDGQNRIILCSDMVYNLVLYNDWFYYFNSEEGKIKKIKMDGSSGYGIYKTDLDFFMIDNGWIYFSNMEKQKICRIDLEGKNETDILNTYADYFNILDGKIYYCIINGAVHKVNMDTHRDEIYIDENILRFYLTQSVLLYDSIDRINGNEELNQKCITNKE